VIESHPGLHGYDIHCFFVTPPSIRKWFNFCKELHNYHERTDERRHEFARDYVAMWYERSVLFRYHIT
jgi:hypothetical protein